MTLLSPRPRLARRLSKLVAMLTAFALPTAVTAQQGQPAPRPAPAPSAVRAPVAPPMVPAPRPGDVETVEGILEAIYASISGPVGQPRDWARFRSLFLPGARLIPVQYTPSGERIARFLSPEDYIATSGPQLERIGFTEKALVNRVERFNDIAQVFSSYEGLATQNGQQVVATRGVNSIQLMWDGSRWWVTTIFWSAERPDATLPAELDRPR